MLLHLALPLLLAGCEPDPASDPPADLTCDQDGDETVLLVRDMRFVRLDEPGVSAGFDLDGQDGLCGVGDLTSPDGVPSIDNAVASLMPVLDQTEAGVIEELAADSIRGGALLLMAALSEIDDDVDDACVDVSVFKGTGFPMIGADGHLLPYQTFPLDPNSLGNEAQGALIDGVFEAGPIGEVALPIQVLDLNTVLRLYDVRLRVEQGDDGVWYGLLGGGLTVQQLIDTATLGNVDPNLYGIIAPVLARLADLAPDENGVCQQISVTLKLELVPAFVYEGATE